MWEDIRCLQHYDERVRAKSTVGSEGFLYLAETRREALLSAQPP